PNLSRPRGRFQGECRIERHIPSEIGLMNRWRPRILLLLAVTSLYLYGYPAASLTYSGVLLFHLVAGIALTILLVPYFLRNWRDEKFLSRMGWSALALGAILGIVLIKIG